MYKIVIVEDDNALCTNMNEMLIKWGFETASVDNFENIARDTNMDIIILGRKLARKEWRL